MAIIDRAMGWLGYTKAIRPPAALMSLAGRERYAIPDYSLADHQLRLYQQLSWVEDAVSIVAKAFAGVSLSVVRLDGEETEDIPNHPFEELLRRPNPMQSRYRLLESTGANLRLAGNAYWYLNGTSASAPPAEIYSLPANRIKVVPGGKVGTVSHYEFDVGQGETVRLETWEIVHFANYHPTNMWTGLSPIESIAREAEKDIKAAEYDLNFYAEDFGKPEGILGWKGTLPPPLKEALEARFKRRHGGTKRSIALLENVEDIQYLQLALNYPDMDFVNNRTFTKEQIYNHFAPGLAAMLAVNATEANSRTGKATLMEFGVWPMHQLVAETIANRILPLYGENLSAEFEDVRLSDKAMELEEFDRAAKVMTIAEGRARFWNMKPLGDARDEQLIAEVVELGAVGQFPAPASGAAPIAPVARIMEPGGGGAETGGQMKAAPVVEVAATPAQSRRDAAQVELMTWQRFVEKRIKAGKKPLAERAFETQMIPEALKGAVEGALETVDTVEGARRIFAEAQSGLAWEGYP